MEFFVAIIVILSVVCIWSLRYSLIYRKRVRFYQRYLSENSAKVREMKNQVTQICKQLEHATITYNNEQTAA